MSPETFLRSFEGIKPSLEYRILKTTISKRVTVRHACLFSSNDLMCERLMFWHVDERQYNVDELVKTADTMVERAQERGVSPKDLDALREAKTHM